MFAYCGNNPIDKKDEAGSFWNYVIGGVVGGLVAGLSEYKKSGDLTSSLIAGAVGAFNGAVAASGLSMLAQAGISALATFVGDVGSQMIKGETLESANYCKAGYNAVLSAGCSIIGSFYGSLASSGYASAGAEMLSSAQDKLLTGYVRQSLGQSCSKLLRQGRTLATEAARQTNIGRGICSVVGTILTWGAAFKYSR